MDEERDDGGIESTSRVVESGSACPSFSISTKI